MCKPRIGKIRLPASAFITALAGMLAVWFPQAAQAQCDNAAGGIITVVGPYAAHPSLIHLGETATINKMGIANNGTSTPCTVTDLKAWVVYPDNSVQLFLNQVTINPLGIDECHGSSGVTVPACDAFTTSWVIHQSDISNSISFVTNWPPDGFIASFVHGGTAKQVQFGVAGACTFFDFNQTPAVNNGDGSPQLTRPLTVLFPCVHITKNCANTCTPYGQPIAFSGIVTNCGDTTLSAISVTDNPPATITFATTTLKGQPYDGSALASGDSVTYTGSYSPADSGGTSLCGPFSDTITVNASDVTGFGVTDSASQTCHVSTSPSLDLTKDCFKLGSPGVKNLQVGDQYVETFTVTNTGNVPLTSVTVHDTVKGITTDYSCSALLGIGGICVVTITNGPVSAADCPSITDSATATGNNLCPSDQTCPSSLSVTSAVRTCTVTVPCVPRIAVYKQVVCLNADGSCGPFSTDLTTQKSAIGAKAVNNGVVQCPAFCYQITVSNISDPGIAILNLTVTDTNYPGGIPVNMAAFGCSFPTSLGVPGSANDHASCILTAVTLCDTTTNIVKANGEGSVVSTGTDAGPVGATDTNGVVIVPFSVTCTKEVSTNGIDWTSSLNIVAATCPSSLFYRVTVSTTSDLPLVATVHDDNLGCGDITGVLVPAHGSTTANLCNGNPVAVNTSNSCLTNTVEITAIVNSNPAQGGTNICSITTNLVQGVHQPAEATSQCSAQACCHIPGLTISKNCDSTCFAYGSPISFNGSVCNIGVLPLGNIAVIDTPPATIVFAATTSSGRPFDTTTGLTNGECVNYTGSYTPTGDLCGPFHDTVIASATVSGVSPTLTISATNEATCHVSTSPSLDLTKDCYKLNLPGVKTLQAGDQYVEVFTVTNTGNVPLTSVTIHDTVKGVTTDYSCAATLDIAGTCVVTITNGPVAVSDCPGITDSATATANNLCPLDQTCPSSLSVTSAVRTCTVTVPCIPRIAVYKQVVCLDSCPNGFSTDLTTQKSAIGAKAVNNGIEQCPAFCYQITVSNISDAGIVLSNVTVSDIEFSTVLPAGGAAVNLGQYGCHTFDAPITLGVPGSPDDHASCILTGVTLCETTTNVVTATGSGFVLATGTPACAANQTPPCSVSSKDTNKVVIVPISVSCDKQVSTNGTDWISDRNGCVDLGSPGVPVQVSYRVIVNNLSDLPLTAVTSDATFGCPPTTNNIPANGSVTNALCAQVTLTCPAMTNNTVDISAIVNTNPEQGGTNICSITTNIVNGVPQPVEATSSCSACVKCEVLLAPSCRTTGGGRQDKQDALVICPDDNVLFVTHGGQVGAPVGNSNCIVTAEFARGNPCIQGEWEHVRHLTKGNKGLEGNFHARVFDTLDCACLDTNLDSNCEYGKATVKGKVCGDRSTGPLPRPAGANKMTFTGIGNWTCDNGAREPRSVLFRVDIEDRGEPGNSHALGASKKTNRVPDRYRIRIWVLTDAELAQLNSGSNVPGVNDPYLLNFRNCISACNGIDFRDGVTCAFQPNTCSGDICGGGSTGTIYFGLNTSCTVRTPNIDDGGELLHGNRQIHPQIKACDPETTNKKVKK